MKRDILFWLVAAVAALTLAVGMLAVLLPAPLLVFLAVDPTAAARYLFGLFGLFVALFGGALLHAMFGSGDGRMVMLWAGIEKFAVVTAFAIGLADGILGRTALVFVGADLVSGVLIIALLRRTPAAQG